MIEKLMTASLMKFKALQKTTLLDYPGKIACILFVGGCNFRCPFCQNPQVVLTPEKIPDIPQEEFFSFLEKRRGLLEGVVISGGEPTIYSELPEFIKKVKAMGFLVKLDTNGSNPEMVKYLLKNNLIDYLAMDYKGPLAKYEIYIGQIQKEKGKNQNQIAFKVKQTIKTLLESNIDFELRTTVVPVLHSKEDLIQMAKEIGGFQKKRPKRKISWYLQQFRSLKCLDPNVEKIKPYQKEFFVQILPELKKYLPEVFFRG